MKQRSEPELLHLAAAYCSEAERCIYDVKKKITSAGATPEMVNRIIAYLLKEKFIDERRYCRCFVNDKLRFNHWGRIRLRYELQKKGIAPGLLAEAMDSIDEENYAATVSELLQNKKRITQGHSEQDLFHKLYRFAASKGFESDIIRIYLKPLCTRNDDASFME